jgi:allene oxide cyclase
MKRLLIPAAAAAVAVLVFAVVNATAGGSGATAKGGNSIHVVEHATSDAVTNGDPVNDVAGNVLTFANDVYDAGDQHKVGSDQGYCVRIVVGSSWECNWTTFLPNGQITVEGPFSDTGNTVVAVTGGTGAYRNVRGSMQLNYHNQAGTEFDFVFDLVG